MNEHLKLSHAGETLIKHYESCKLKAYYCPAGKLTIGWGHTNDHGRQFTKDTVWTQAQADAAFIEDMQHFGEGVKRRLKREATQGQYDALVSFAYNCGLGALDKSTILRKFNAGDMDGAARAFHLWNKMKQGGKMVVAKGLVRRRASEALLFQGDDGEDAEMPQAVEPSRGKPAVQSKNIWTTIGVAATSLFGVFSQAFEQTKHLISDPLVLATLTVLVLAGGAFLVNDRMQKMDEGV